jgi:23S rRNA pseudouridine1911/1915/1917 synthase
MHPGPEHGSDTLQNGLVARYPELLALGFERGFGLVHRLDRETSGLLVVARTVRAYEGLTGHFAARQVEKRYRALTKGAPAAGAEGTVEGSVDGQEAVTRWRLVERTGARKWVVGQFELHPLTGRKHQLRIHLAGLGWPILGDKRHGAEGMPIAKQLGLRRVALHAEALAFCHPATGERLAFEAAWPPELERAWRHARTVGDAM